MPALPKLPGRYAAIVTPLLLSFLMTCLVSFVTLVRSVGMTTELPGLWLSAWWASWLVAFPVLLVVLPLVRRVTALLVETP